jgi:hypothetical protein
MAREDARPIAWLRWMTQARLGLPKLEVISFSALPVPFIINLSKGLAECLCRRAQSSRALSHLPLPAAPRIQPSD